MCVNYCLIAMPEDEQIRMTMTKDRLDRIARLLFFRDGVIDGNTIATVANPNGAKDSYRTAYVGAPQSKVVSRYHHGVLESS